MTSTTHIDPKAGTGGMLRVLSGKTQAPACSVSGKLGPSIRLNNFSGVLHVSFSWLTATQLEVPKRAD